MTTKTAGTTIKMVTFIRKFRQEITKRIFELHPDLKKFVKTVNDYEREVMVKNEPSLKTWAKSKGVVIA